MNSIANISKQGSRLWPAAVKQNTFLPNPWKTAPAAFSTAPSTAGSEVKPKNKSERVIEFQKKLRAKTPLGKLDELVRHPFQEKEPLKPWPNSVNPHTGEIGGPAGPEPTRYGDWERKGRVSDF